jgi:hypothetical protein
VSFIGTLEQLKLPQVFQRLETYEKGGLLVIKQGEKWIEFYFQQGRLMCVGPVEANTNFGEQLLHAGVISPQALQQLIFTTGSIHLNETRVALTLMDLGYVNQESLRAWATMEAVEKLRVALSWPIGEIYFEDGAQPPADRLLIALSVVPLLSSASSQIRTSQPIYTGATSTVTQERPDPVTRVPDTPGSQALLSASELVSEDSFVPPVASSPASSQPYLATVVSSSSNTPATSLTAPKHIPRPTPPRRIDTSFMTPEMMLVPTDLSSLREQNPRVQLTPDQWRLFTLADGCTSLKMACQALGVTREVVCLVAGELIALGLAHVILPSTLPVNELSPVSRDVVASGLSNGYVTPGYAASTPQPWAVMPAPTTGTLRPFSPQTSMATQAQWGSGESGMMFVPGQGWVQKPQPLRTEQQNDPVRAFNGVYTYVGGR